MRRSVAGMMLLLTVGSTETVETNTQLVVRQVAVQTETETPYADSLIDWDEQERQNNCLWKFLQDADVELTLDTVIAAGDWTDALGGACAAIGED